MTALSPEPSTPEPELPAVRHSSRRLGLARISLGWAALSAAYLLYYLPSPGTSSRPGAIRAWVILAGIIALAWTLQRGIGRRRRIARRGTMLTGLGLGVFTLWGAVRFWQAWDGANLGPAAVLSYGVVLMALFGFIVAAVCCAAAPTARYGWH